MAPTTPSIATRTAPPVNCTTVVLPGVLLLVAVVEGETSVALVAVVGSGALLDDGVDVGVMGAAAVGVEEDFELVDGDGATTREEDVTGAAVLDARETETVWLALKPAERVMLNPRAQVAGSSPWF